MNKRTFIKIKFKLRGMTPNSDGELEPQPCLVCKGREAEGVEHYLLRCPNWIQWRRQWITPILDSRGMGESMERSEPVGMMLLGGRQGVRIVFADGTAKQAEVVETHQKALERDWLVGVARFIQATWCRRDRILREIESMSLEGRCPLRDRVLSNIESMSLVPPRGKAQTGRPIANSEQSVLLRSGKPRREEPYQS
jgi:hypothetical protein